MERAKDGEGSGQGDGWSIARIGRITIDDMGMCNYNTDCQFRDSHHCPTERGLYFVPGSG